VNDKAGHLDLGQEFNPTTKCDDCRHLPRDTAWVVISFTTPSCNGQSTSWVPNPRMRIRDSSSRLPFSLYSISIPLAVILLMIYFSFAGCFQNSVLAS
jgi:hypothetical protein